MLISFRPLFELMKEKKITSYWMVQHGVDFQTLHRLRHDMNTTTNTIDKLCKILECTPMDVIEYKQEAASGEEARL